MDARTLLWAARKVRELVTRLRVNIALGKFPE